MAASQQPAILPDGLLQFLSSSPENVGLAASCDLLAVAIKRTFDQTASCLRRNIPLVSCRDSLHCAMSGDSITAVREPTYELGRESARLMHSLLCGHQNAARSTTLKASQISVRVSTVDPATDLLVARAVTFIQDNAARAIRVPDILAFLNTSRVTFERRFRDVMGRSPGEEIRRVRLEYARQLLLNTDASIGEIALSCGFETANRFSTFFRNGTGLSPSEFRKDNPGKVEDR